MNDKHFTHDEVSLMSIYNAAGTREGLIAALTEMRGYEIMSANTARKGRQSMENNLTYTRNGDYMIPDLKIEVPEQPLGKYGRMRQKYLKERRPILWNQMILEETLFPHLLEIEQAAQRRLEQMMPKLASEAGATEALKASDPMKWVGLMNTCKAQAEEVILAELIYA